MSILDARSSHLRISRGQLRSPYTHSNGMPLRPYSSHNSRRSYTTQWRTEPFSHLLKTQSSLSGSLVAVTGKFGQCAYTLRIRIWLNRTLIQRCVRLPLNRIVTANTQKGPIIAIKVLHERDPEAFRREVEMLTPLTIRCNHPHIIKLLATYEYQSKYHLIFHFARENLRSSWKSHQAIHWNRGTLLWMIEQLVGLTSGLNTIHEFRTGRTAPLRPESPNREATVSRTSREGQLLGIKAGEKKFGRHGDIKPENILVMGKGANSLGFLQLADMGLSRFHRLDSRSKVDHITVNGSATYVPPELALKNMVNRKCDIWSLGCVVLEFIIKVSFLLFSPSLFLFLLFPSSFRLTFVVSIGTKRLLQRSR